MSHIDAPFPRKDRTFLRDLKKRREEKRDRDEQSGGKPKNEHHRSIPLWAETIVLLLIALVLAILIKQFFVQAFYIPSGSMEPGLIPNDRILVEKWSYWMGSPKRGDIVVFSDPAHWLDQEGPEQSSNFVTSTLGAVGLYPVGGHLVKRVIGTAGDHVYCDPAKDGGRLMINGVAVNESSYLPSKKLIAPLDAPPTALNMPETSACQTAFSVVVPAGDIWVMGDNRGDSSDSRFHMSQPGCGAVPVKDVVGKVFAVVWPLGHMKLIHRPSVFNHVPAPTSAANAAPVNITCNAG
ncbi:MAG TPA: signal peptidase I [Marmoricola sp.]|nr:signal peptidase I [Marmoricola sp.]